jgi:hypothetical protein
MFKPFTIILLVLSALNCYAQDSIAPPKKIKIWGGWRFGAGAAIQTNTFYNNEELVKFIMSPVSGAVIRIDFNHSISMIGEAMYNGKGFSYKNELNDTVSVYKSRLHYIDFPILLHARIGNARFSEFFELGFSTSYVAGGYLASFKTVDGNSVSSSYDKIIFNKPKPDPIKRFDMSVILGAGIGFKTKNNNRLNIGFRYHIGLLDIYKDSKFGAKDGQKQAQRLFYLHAGYYIPLRK